MFALQKKHQLMLKTQGGFDYQRNNHKQTVSFLMRKPKPGNHRSQLNPPK